MRTIVAALVGVALGAVTVWGFFARGSRVDSAAQAQRAQNEIQSLRAELKQTQVRLEERERAWVRFNEDWKTAVESKAQPKGAPDPSPSQELASPPSAQDPQSFLARFNAALVAQSQKEWRLEECAGVEGGVVLDPLLYRIGPQGTVSGMLQCKTMYLTLPPVPQAAWLWCRNGEWIEGGKKEPLPDWGFRIDLAPVDLDALRAGLPELFYSQSVKPSGVDETVEASSGGTVPPPELLRARLNALLEKDPGGYRIVKMSAASALELREIEIEEGSPGDPTARYIAARAFPRFDLQGKTVELILERGSVDRKGKRSTIPSSGFRLHFPGVTPSSWKAAGGPSPR